MLSSANNRELPETTRAPNGTRCICRRELSISPELSNTTSLRPHWYRPPYKRFITSSLARRKNSIPIDPFARRRVRRWVIPGYRPEVDEWFRCSLCAVRPLWQSPRPVFMLCRNRCRIPRRMLHRNRARGRRIARTPIDKVWNRQSRRLERTQHVVFASSDDLRDLLQQLLFDVG
jgi:hypothetical protein